ncbi:RGI-lyase domain-containing protein [Fusarium sp. LHS14.1]|nr:RGI-lyase domain-containing protein [Fusarium sp. LHS14.1]
MRPFLYLLLCANALLGLALAAGPRPIENLGRGVVAVRSSEDDILVTWRLLGLDPDGISFNVYRASNNDQPKRLNSEALTGGTNFIDSTADAGSTNTYTVRAVVDGKEQKTSGSFTLPADNAVEPVVRIPLRSGSTIKYVWVGDLDGEGEWDFVIDRHSTQQSIEAYTSNGTFLWDVNLGPGSENQNNISPGPSAIDVGHWDGVTVFDFDSDGLAEVAIRVSNGVTFGDGNMFTRGKDDNQQFIAILDGRTGALRASSPLPTDYASDGPMGARFGAGFLDGKTPHLFAYLKNRRQDKNFNLLMLSWTFDGKALKQQWKWDRGTKYSEYPDGHNTRILDVDGDGKDEVFEIGFTLNGDGTIRYTLHDQGVVHGDRFHIAKMDPERDGLQGYGIQQNNEGLLYDYYYDATDGKMIWEHKGDEVIDLGRGMVGDIDPTHPGMEVWSTTGGLYNAKENKPVEADTEFCPWPHLGIWWDGDVLLELFNDGKIEKWNWDEPTLSNKVPRITHINKFGGVTNGRNPTLIGDILGDWREEVVVTNAAMDELLIFTTDQPSDIRLYTLAHNPNYRNDLTVKGYIQSHHVDYFLGQGMDQPPQPNIRYTQRA